MLIFKRYYRYIILLLSVFYLASCTTSNQYRQEFMSHVKNKDLQAANVLYEQHRDQMQDDISRNMVNIVASQLGQSYNDRAALLAEIILYASKDSRDQAVWPTLKNYIERGEQLTNDYQKNTLAQKQLQDTKGIDDLATNLAMLDAKYQEASNSLFTEFDHFSGQNFFKQLPAQIADKDALLLGSVWENKFKKAKLEPLSLFYATYYQDFKWTHMEVLRDLIMAEQVKLFLGRHEKLTLFEAPLFEAQLQTFKLNASILKLKTEPSAFILNIAKKGAVSIELNQSSLSLFDKAIPIEFAKSVNNTEAQYAIYILPNKGQVNILKTAISDIASKYESGTQLVDNPDYKVKRQAQQVAEQTIKEQEQALKAVIGKIYQLNQGREAMISAVVTGQKPADEVTPQMIPMALLTEKEMAQKNLANAKQALELANMDLIKTNKSLSVPAYQDYKVKQKDLTVQKKLDVTIYLKRAFQSGYEQYKTHFTEQQRFTAFENVNLKDAEMMKRKLEANTLYNEYKNKNIAINVRLEDLKTSMKFVRVVNAIN